MIIMNATHPENLLVPAQLVVAVSAILHLWSVAQWRAHTRGLPLSPGPRRLPVVGNMFDLLRSRQWVGYRDLSRELGEQACTFLQSFELTVPVEFEGDVMYFQVLGQSIVVLGSSEAIVEYLDKRSTNTSSHPEDCRCTIKPRSSMAEVLIRLCAATAG